ncbi:MFS transporter [Herbiconiux sp. L3-i23]|nr:MFS transporter [Herbiconiux sp. L3-i23]
MFATGGSVPRSKVFAWALWDWATQPFNTVINTFVFTALYLLTEAFTSDGVSVDDLSAQLGLAVGLAGVVVAVLAPVLGRRTDAGGNRKRWLMVWTALLAVAMGAMFFVEESPSFFLLGAILVAVAGVFSELAAVNYNAMIVQVATPRTLGKVSGLGWGFGYIGGIITLVLVIVAQLSSWFGIPDENGLPLRLVAVMCAVWTVVFSIPLFLAIPEIPPVPSAKRSSFFGSYVDLARDVARIFREDRPLFWFLLASAIYRDGLSAVFAFGGAIASVTFGFEFMEVVVFGVAGNLVAGLSTIIAGRLDDRFGPRAVIIGSIAGLVVSGLGVFLLRDAGTAPFWVGGLLLCLFVGPAQAASRSYLARATPPGHEGELFGLYATTGRAASFIAPLAFSGFIAWFGAQAFGIIGIVLVLAVGGGLMFLIRTPRSAANSVD